MDGSAHRTPPASSVMILGFIEAVVTSVCVTVIGLLYPAYSSYKCIANKGDPKPWIIYWITFAIWSQAMALCDLLYISSVSLFPAAKVGSLIYLVQVNRAEAIYAKVLEPFLARHEVKIDEMLQAATQFAQRKLEYVRTQATEMAKGAAKEAVKGAAKESTVASADAKDKCEHVD